MDGQHSEAIVIGAGMAGLACATRLAGAGMDVRVLDKGRGPGGRMATRRAHVAGNEVSFDHGAQYFTARDPAFRAAVAAWEQDGVVARWPAAREDAWVGVPGMNAPIRAMAQGLDVRWNTRALALSFTRDRWQVDTGEGLLSSRLLCVAVPAEQAHALIGPVAPNHARRIAGVVSEPCWAVMAAFDAPLGIGADVLRAPDSAIAWAARNSAKPGRAGTECWVLHASPQRSREIVDLPADEAAYVLLAEFFRQAGTAPRPPVHLAAHRWLYAMPRAHAGEPAIHAREVSLGIAGDYLHSPRVEGAWISGRALADMVLQARVASTS